MYAIFSSVFLKPRVIRLIVRSHCTIVTDGKNFAGGNEENVDGENKTFGEGATGKYVPKPKMGSHNGSDVDTLNIKYKEMSIEKTTHSFPNEKSGATNKFHSTTYNDNSSKVHSQYMGGKKKKRSKNKRSNCQFTGTIVDSVESNNESDKVEVASEAENVEVISEVENVAVISEAEDVVVISEAGNTYPNTQESVVEESNSVSNVETTTQSKSFMFVIKALFKKN